MTWRLCLVAAVQAGVRKARSVHASGGSSQWVASIQAAGGLVRTNIPMKNTIFRIALTNKKQVGGASAVGKV